MPRNAISILAVTLAVAMTAPSAPLDAQELVDRIVARVENDVILLSEIRSLSRYQQLVDGKSEAAAQILDRLIDQWIVRTEAEVSRQSQPSDAEVDRVLNRLRSSFPSGQEFEARKKQAGLADQDLRAMISSQLFLSNYLDSRFRPGVQIDPKAIEVFYEKSVVPRAKARGQEPPSLEASRDAIEEALVENGINEQADQWLKESRQRLRIEKLLNEGPK